jgi:hypothetical protein
MATPRQGATTAVSCTTLCGLGRYSRILLVAECLREQQALTVRRAAWDAKERVPCSETLAMVRRWLWAEQPCQRLQTDADMIKVTRSFFERLTETLCYAA